MQLFQQARAALGAVHPWLPALVLMFVIWAPAAAIRRWLPALWEGPANWGPFGAEELTPIWKVLRKAWQAIPAAAAGAFVAAIAAHHDPWAPVLGAVVGLGAPAFHEIKKLAGRMLGGPPSSAAGVLLVAGALALGTPACGMFGTGGGNASQADLRAAALGYNGACVALELVAAAEADRMAAIESPTLDQIAQAEARVARLRRVRDALEVARAWLAGETEQGDARRAVHDAAELLRLAVAELRADGVLLPEAVSRGLAAASVWAGS